MHKDLCILRVCLIKHCIFLGGDILWDWIILEVPNRVWPSQADFIKPLLLLLQLPLLSSLKLLVPDPVLAVTFTTWGLEAVSKALLISGSEDTFISPCLLSCFTHMRISLRNQCKFSSENAANKEAPPYAQICNQWLSHTRLFTAWELTIGWIWRAWKLYGNKNL